MMSIDNSAVNVITFDYLKFCSWLCCFVGVLPCRHLYSGCHLKLAHGS